MVNLLEVKKSLQTAAKEEPWLGHDILQTHCTSQDMACNDIINIRRCENVPSNYIAEKLKSQPIEHQDPYKLQWLNKDNEVIKVSQHSIASFSISKIFKERLRFDVIPVDVCHLLPERHWQYDRHALYDGYANTYTFGKDGIKIKLAPLPIKMSSMK